MLLSQDVVMWLIAKRGIFFMDNYKTWNQNWILYSWKPEPCWIEACWWLSTITVSVGSGIYWVGHVMNVAFKGFTLPESSWIMYIALTTFSKTCSRRFGRISHFLGYWSQLCQTAPVSNRTTTWNKEPMARCWSFTRQSPKCYSFSLSLSSPFLKWLLEDYLRDHHPILHFPIFLELITGKSHSHLLISQN